MIDWNQAIKYAQLVKLAESVKPGDNYSNADKANIQAAGYQFIEQLYGDDLATDLDPHLGAVVSFGFLALSPQQELVAAVRGTGTALEWGHDGAFLLVPCPINGAHGFTEDGFSAVYKSLRIDRPNGSLTAKDSIRSYVDSKAATSVTVCGHSLGGALATLLTLDVALNTSCRTPVSYTYASPRTGEHLFAGSYNATVSNSFRIVNRFDVVPKLPPIGPLPYEHVDTVFELIPGPDEIKKDLGCKHHLTTYLYLMGKQVALDFPLNPECRVAP